MKHPCVKDCPKRSCECRKTCQKWKEYEAWYIAEHKRKSTEYLRRDAAYAYWNSTAKNFRRLVAEV